MLKLFKDFIGLAAIAVVLAGALAVSAQDFTKVPGGQKLETLGIITIRGADSFQLRTLDGRYTYIVLLSYRTSVKSNRRGAFRRGKTYEASYLLRGLRVTVVGYGNSVGELRAESVRFNETDLRTAQSLESRVDPLERRTAAQEANAKKLAGQLEEEAALAAAALAKAEAAQKTADEALKDAARANNRINGLDQFDLVNTIYVPFATGRYTLGPRGRATIDRAAAQAKKKDTKGWLIAVIGFADSTGSSARNKILSERRANTVIGYLVSKHNLPIHRLVQPFGYGSDKPAASNKTAEGRALNRRVEIRVLVNKGIAGTL